LPDDHFLRGDVPMTKELVRAATICKLRLRPEHLVYDIGAGTGSVAIECALQADHGWVYAIERSPLACALIEQNIARFAVRNLKLVPGEAPTALADLPAPDRVFVGGAGGQLPAILDAVLLKNPRCRIVINAILLESAAEAVQALQARGCQPEVVQLSSAVARPVAAGSLMLAQNPVYIISGGSDDE
jgi:precorrin-6Y C5,15-methyltransferase (decarboxylating)